MINEFDFYKGYEGEPQIIISQREMSGELKTTISLWAGYFDSIIRLIVPNVNGYWEGVALIFHTHSGWYDKSPWRCDDLGLFLVQLESINVFMLDVQSQEILNLVISVLKESIELNDYLYIEYE